MSVSRRVVALVAMACTAVALAVSFAGVASGARASSLPSAIISVHADPGHISTRLVGTNCGGYITVDAVGQSGGSGKASCGRNSVVVAATPNGTFDSVFANASQASFVCQANALFASAGVDVTCTENVD
jgi:hypothetical protein